MIMPADVASPSLSSSTGPPLSASAKPSSRTRAQPSLSADPFSSAVGFPGHRRAGEGGEDTAMNVQLCTKQFYPPSTKVDYTVSFEWHIVNPNFSNHLTPNAR